MDEKGLPSQEYRRALMSVAERPLEAGIGLQSYASFRREKDRLRSTVYFQPEIYHPGTIASAGMRPAPQTPEEIVDRFESASVVDNPFMRRLRREPVDLRKLWLLMSNAQVGIVNDFSRRLAQTVAKATDDRVRCILASQLNDELGSGQYERAHSQLFKKLLEGLAPWRPANSDESLFEPGRALSEELESVYYTLDPFEGVGATIVIEIFGRQVDQFLGDEFRRQKEVDPASLEWLNLHEGLEVEHADESLQIARLVPQGSLPSLWRGADRIGRAGTAFFDAMYGVCFR
jgi:hypothetical protein